MNDPTVCRNCTSLNGKLILANKELSELRIFQQEVRDAFGTTDTEKLHLTSEVVELAKQAAVIWETAPMGGATNDVLQELANAVKAMASHRSTFRKAQMAAVGFPQSPDVIRELAAEQRASEDTRGGAERSHELDPINDPHNRDQR